MRGIRRAKGMAPNGKAPLLPAQLRQAIDALPDTLLGKRDHAILVIGFAGAFRRSELVALTMEDIQITGEGLIVTLRRSKTDQEGQTMVRGLPERNECGDLSGEGLGTVGDSGEDHIRADLSSGQPLRHGRYESAEWSGRAANREGGVEAR